MPSNEQIAYFAYLAAQHGVKVRPSEIKQSLETRGIWAETLVPSGFVCVQGTTFIYSDPAGITA